MSDYSSIDRNFLLFSLKFRLVPMFGSLADWKIQAYHL
jgi:hypothetical protein